MPSGILTESKLLDWDAKNISVQFVVVIGIHKDPYGVNTLGQFKAKGGGTGFYFLNNAPEDGLGHTATLSSVIFKRPCIVING